jgi:hypothetical protein
LSEAISAACKRSRLVNDSPTGSRERAPPDAICLSLSVMVVAASMSTLRSSTTRIAISLEIEAIGRTSSAFLVNSSSPLPERSTTTADWACTLGIPPRVYTAMGRLRAARCFLANAGTPTRGRVRRIMEATTRRIVPIRMASLTAGRNYRIVPVAYRAGLRTE